MGDFDRQPADWNLYADAGWAPEHVIFCNSKWSARPDRHDHAAVEDVRACYLAAKFEKAGVQVWPCSWSLGGRYDDGTTFEYPCDAPTMFTDDRGSYECSAGHTHVPAELRWEQGWDYAADEGEAALLRKHGVDAVGMDGGSI